jgi:ABC-type uncharacterized transport system permease subunit
MSEGDAVGLAELLFWPALVGYGEAALAYAGDARRPGRLGRLATWGVRAGWVAQGALLAAQAVAAGRFPWTTWAGSLNLFVWLIVSVYLFWGCRSRFRLLGLAVMPLAVPLFVAAWAGGGTGQTRATGYPNVFLVAHVGLVLAGFAGLTLAAALAALYLWQERRLKRHEVGILTVRAPALVTLDGLAARTVALSLPVLTLGIVAGLVRLADEGERVDALVAVTLAVWMVYAALLALRLVGWRGRRAAYVALGGLGLVLAVHFGLVLTHF